MAGVSEIERTVLGYDRGEVELDWLLGIREGHLFLRGDQAVGFAFVGKDGAGPIAAFDPADLPDILLHVERRALAVGLERLGFEVPSLNVTAVRHLLGRGFRLETSMGFLMANQPFGQFDRFIGFSPPVFL